MTDTKPTLEEQIKLLKDIWHKLPLTEDGKHDFLNSLKELQSIRLAEMPVEPDELKNMRYPWWLEGNVKSVLEYIDALKAYALKEKERADSAERDDSQKAEANRELWQRTEKAESELAALRLELARINGDIPYGN